MTQKNAQIIFIAFNIVAVLLVAYVVSDFVSINGAIIDKEKTIPFDIWDILFFINDCVLDI